MPFARDSLPFPPPLSIHPTLLQALCIQIWPHPHVQVLTTNSRQRRAPWPYLEADLETFGTVSLGGWGPEHADMAS